MGYATTRDLCEEKRVFKSVKVNNSDSSVPCDKKEIVTIGPGAAIIKDAEIKSEEILKRATDESTKVTEKARADGFGQGKNDAKNKYDSLLKSMSSALDSLEGMRKEISENLSESIIALGLDIAGRILKKEIENDPSIIKDMVSDILAGIAPAREAVIKFNQKDFEALKDFRPEFESGAGYPDKFKMTYDPSLGRGDVVVQYERGTIDARIATQLENIARSLMES
jgi:flagellar assembly protein FliH